MRASRIGLPVQLRAVDARDGALGIDYLLRDKPTSPGVTATVDGRRYRGTATPLADTGLSSNVMVVLDSSAGASNGTVQLAKESLASIEPGKGAIARLGLVRTGGGASIVAQPAKELSQVAAVSDGVQPAGENALWDGVTMAARAIAAEGDAQRNVVIVASSADNGSAASFSEALDALRGDEAMVHVIVTAGSTADTAALQDLVTRIGGSFQVSADTDFTEAFTNVASLLANQYRVEIPGVAGSTAELRSLRLSTSAGSVDASFRPGVVSVGADQLAPTPLASGVAGSFWSSDTMKYLIVAMVALGVAGACYALGNLVIKRRDGLDSALRHYEEAYGQSATAEENEQAILKSALLQRAVAVTGTIAEERGVLVRVENLLERADLPLRAAEALTLYLGGALLSVVVTMFVSGSVLATLAVVILALILPGFVVDFMAKRRKKKFNALLPDMLQLLAGTLRAGYSIGQGIEAVSKEVDEPMGKELRRAVTEARLGRQLDEALEAVAFRMDSEDFEWAVMAIRIQREVGGNLAELLMTVAETMVQRERLRRDVAALTAEGRMSAIILGLLPPGLGVAMYVMNPEYISKLFSGIGLFLLGASIVMMLVGFVWMKKTITIEV
ncbi:MAG: type II secretion system F family protein [Microthrixaceae bacterium]